MLAPAVSQKKNRILPFACICFILQVALAPDIVLGAGQINFALIFVVICSLSKRDNSSIIYAFVAGLLFDLLSSEPVGIMSCLLSIVSYVTITKIHLNVFEDVATSSMVFSALTLVLCLIHFMVMLACGEVTSFVTALIYRVLPVFILTSCAFVPLVLIFRKLSGTTSGRSRMSQLRSSHSPSLHL